MLIVFRTGLLLVLALLVTACEQQKSSLTIGFVGGLSGRVADLGVSGRDGAILAVEEINAAGGIAGAPVTLLIRDDGQDAQKLTQAVQGLIDDGVTGIVGPMTSSMAVVAAPLVKRSRAILLSPTTSTNELAVLDDRFIRVYPPSQLMARRLAEHAYNVMGLRRIAVVYDEANRSHTHSWYQHFEAQFRKLGGESAQPVTFTSGASASYSSIAAMLVHQRADALFILASALDTAVICQQLAKLSVHKPVLVSEWSATEDLIAYGGNAVEGVTFFNTFDRDYQGKAYLEFVASFRERFKYDPGFASMHAYDATRLLLSAMSKAPGLDIKDAVLGYGEFPALQGSVKLDAYGDAQRDLFLMRVMDGKFQRVSDRDQ
jgi:branched-chain amino acid transport system substrate-binding protein